MASPFKRASEENIDNYYEFLKKDKPRFVEFFNRKIRYNASLDDFVRMQALGSGAFGRVYLIKHKTTEKYYALKVLDKKKVVSLKQVDHTRSEKRILQALNFPFTVYLDCYFADNSYIYFVLPFVCGGELFNLLRRMKTFDEEQAKFYAAQVCLGLDYLHYLDLVYRDLKPENIIIDEKGYIKITDFGFCKLINGRTYTLCGTPEYLAPEVILSRGYGFSVDWWSFGILLYEMSAGYTPFVHNDPIVMYEKITAGKYKVPAHFSVFLRDLIRNLLQIDLSRRFGNLQRGADDIKDHRWFKQINWISLLNKRVKSPYQPKPRDPNKISDKNPEEPLKVSEVDRYAKEFENF